MHYAIETRYFGPSTNQGSRVKALWRGGRKRSVFIPYNHALSSEAVHTAAATALLAHEAGRYAITAAGATDTGYVFIVESV